MMKKILYNILTLILVTSCMDLSGNDPYESTLNMLVIDVQWPDNVVQKEGASVIVEDVNTGSRYADVTDEEGMVSFTLPNGLYRINLNGRNDPYIYNGVADKVVLSGKDMTLKLEVSVSRSGSLVIKELYCGGCKRLPQEGNYIYDQYFIIHNNHYEVQYLDQLCFGTLSPNNAPGTNPWLEVDPVTGVKRLPESLKIIQAVWQFPGEGDEFPLQPGEDAVVCLRGAVDHSAQYPLSVNLNKSGYFVCYNNIYFPNTSYHPAPGDNISTDRYIDVVIKTGRANAYTLSISSPTLVLFRTEGVTIQDYVLQENVVQQVPGSSVDNVVDIPFEWVVDAIEVFDGRSTANAKRLVPSLDAGYVIQSDIYLGHTLMRKVDEQATVAAGYEVLMDTNNSLNDFYEREKQSLHE